MKIFKYVQNSSFYLDVDAQELVEAKQVCLANSCKVDYLMHEVYLVKNIRHREDGPAYINFTDEKTRKISYTSYWLDGKSYSVEDWMNKISKENRIKYLFNIDKYS